MSPIFPCPHEADDLVHRYVAGSLAAPEDRTFEIHLLDCPACQLAVREGTAVRVALRERRRWSRQRLWLLPALAAAGLLLWLLALPADPWRELAGVTAPVFDGLPVRAERDSAERLVAAGLEAYLRGNYRLAAGRLELADRLAPEPGTAFFLGVSQLLSDQPEAALEPLRRALDSGHPGYASEAAYYLAKAWLGLGQPDSALRNLQRTSGGTDSLATLARALADSVESRMGLTPR